MIVYKSLCPPSDRSPAVLNLPNSAPVQPAILNRTFFQRLLRHSSRQASIQPVQVLTVLLLHLLAFRPPSIWTECIPAALLAFYYLPCGIVAARKQGVLLGWWLVLVSFRIWR